MGYAADGDAVLGLLRHGGLPGERATVGPASGSWKATKNKTGLLMLEMTAEAVRPATACPAILEVCRM